MVKMQAVQSALAIRRQRTRQEEAKKARQRKQSNDSELSTTPRASIVSLNGNVYFDQTAENKRACGHVTMFHVGGVLILIGLMLVIMAMMPSYVKSNSVQKRSDLLGTGSCFVFVGSVLTIISRFISNNEDAELNQYIKGRLTKSRSSHRLKDAEACLSPHKERHKTSHNGVHHSHHHHHHHPHSSSSSSSSSSRHVEPGVHSSKNSHAHKDTTKHHHHEGSSHHNAPKHQKEHEEPPAANCPVSPSKTTKSVDSSSSSATLPHSASSDPVLSRIIEEDEDYDGSTDQFESSLSISSSLETQALLDKTYSARSGSKSSIKSSCKSIKLI